MKTKKIFSVILSIVLMFNGMIGVYAQDESSSAEPIVEAENNPVGDIFVPREPSDKELIIDYSEMPGKKGASKGEGSNTEYCTDISEAGGVLAAQLADRLASPVVYVNFPSGQYGSWTEAARAVVKAAWTHNGIPNQGDYVANTYYSWTCTMYPTSSDGYKGRIVYGFTYLDSAEQEAELAVAIDNLLDELNVDNLNSDIEKVTAVYTWMTSNIVYDYEHLEDSSYLLKHTAYAALIDKTAVCQGYAMLLYRLCLEMGVDCRYITGGNHGWDLVGINGLYYYADSTWDANKHPAKYEYYLIARSNFRNHSVGDAFTSDEFVAQYPSGEENLSYPDSMKIPAEGLSFAEDAPDSFLLSSGQILIYAEVYPLSAYDGYVTLCITNNHVNNGTYFLGESSVYGQYVGIVPDREGSFTVIANGGGFIQERTFYVVDDSLTEARVTFVDKDENGPQDLSQYFLTFELQKGESINTEQSVYEMANDLRNQGYVISDDDIPSVLYEGEVEIPVYHSFSDDRFLNKTNDYIRNIRFVDENGAEIAESVHQYLYRDFYVLNRTDIITGVQFYDGEEEIWRDNKYIFDYYEAPIIDGFGTDIQVVGELEVTDLNICVYDVDVVYHSAHSLTVLSVQTDEDVIVDASAHSEDGKYFAGWSLDGGETVVYPAYQRFTISQSTELFAVFSEENQEAPLDVNARVNGSYRGSLNGIATFDIKIDGQIVKTSITDFYKRYPIGTSFEIVNIQVADGYIFTGVSNAKSYNGCIPADALKGRICAGGITDVSLSFISTDYNGTAGNVAQLNDKPIVTANLMQGECAVYAVSNHDSGHSFSEFSCTGENYYEALFEPTYYLDVNARLNGAYKGNTADIATFDVYINDELSARNVTDYYRRWPADTRYRVVVHTSEGYDFSGAWEAPSSSSYAYGGGIDGSVQLMRTECWLNFVTAVLPEVAVDINAMIGNRYSGNTSGIATFDIYVNDQLVKSNATDFYKKYPVGTKIEVANIQITDDGYLYNGTSPRVSYSGCIHQDSLIFTLVDGGVNDVVLLLDAIPVAETYVDINARVNGSYLGNTSGIATFDVYANGNLVKENATDFYKKFPVGTLIEIRNINVADGYSYVGTSEKESYGNVYHHNELPFYVEGDLVNDVALNFVAVPSEE